MRSLDYRTPEQQTRPNPFFFALSSCGIGLAGNALGMLAASSLRHVAPGSTIRPMGLAALLFLIAAGTAAPGVTLAIVGIIRGIRARRRVLVFMTALLGTLLSLTPLITSRWVWDRIEARNGLVMEP